VATQRLVMLAIATKSMQFDGLFSKGCLANEKASQRMNVHCTMSHKAKNMGKTL